MSALGAMRAAFDGDGNNEPQCRGSLPKTGGDRGRTAVPDRPQRGERMGTIAAAQKLSQLEVTSNKAVPMGAEGWAASAHRATMHSGRTDTSGTTRRTDEEDNDQTMTTPRSRDRLLRRCAACGCGFGRGAEGGGRSSCAAGGHAPRQAPRTQNVGRPHGG